MAGNTVSLTQSIDDREVVKAFEKQNRLLNEMMRRLDDVGRKGKKSGKDTADGAMSASKAFQSMAHGAASALGGVLSINSAMSAVRREFEDMQRRERLAAGAQAGAAEAIRGARAAFIADHTVSDAQLEGEILKAAQATRQSVPLVATAMQDVLSSKGNLTNRQAFETFTQASRLKPGDAAASTTLAARAMDLTKVSGVEDPRQILGLLQNVQASSRVTSLDKLGSTAVPAMTSLAARGDTLEQSGELFATLTNLMADEEGRLAGTAMKNLGTRLADFVPEARGEDKRGRFTVPREAMNRFEAAGSTTARIEAMQQSPELRRQFLGGTSFDAASQAFIEQLLSADPKAMAALNTARRNINPLGAGQRKLFEDTVANLEAGQFQPVLTAQQQSKANIEASQLSSGLRGRFGAVQSIREETLRQIDLPGVDLLTRFGLDAAFQDETRRKGTSPEQAAIKEFESLLDSSRDPTAFARLADGDENLLKEQLKVLKQLEETVKEGNRQAQADRRQVPRRPAAAMLDRRN